MLFEDALTASKNFAKLFAKTEPADAEMLVWRADAKLGEKDVAELCIVILPGMDQKMVGGGI